MKEGNQNKYVFLDIDGVLNSAASRDDDSIEYKTEQPLSRYLVNKLRSWHDMATWLNSGSLTNIYFIGISSWFTSRDVAKELEEVSKLLKIDIVDCIDYCGGGSGRGKSLLDYVEEHEIRYWAVLDDAGGYMYGYPTVNVNGRIGLTDYDLQMVDFFLDSYRGPEYISEYRETHTNAFKRG